jgi:hypothetical protein
VIKRGDSHLFVGDVQECAVVDAAGEIVSHDEFLHDEKWGKYKRGTYA